jgi:hypothetical protein
MQVCCFIQVVETTAIADILSCKHIIASREREKIAERNLLFLDGPPRFDRFDRVDEG